MLVLFVALMFAAAVFDYVMDRPIERLIDAVRRRFR
jgi:hypothetical protein